MTRLPPGFRWRRLALAGAIVATSALVAVGMLKAWRHVPSFYAAALAVEHDVHERGNRAFLRKVAELVSQRRGEAPWRGSFTAEEINGWLAVDLPKNHSQLLADGLALPRVCIDGDRVTVGVRHGVGSTNDATGNLADYGSVFSVTASVFTLAPNRVAVQIHSAHSGLIPLPLDAVIEAISRAGQQCDVPVVWQHSDGDPVAIVVLPDAENDTDILTIDNVTVADGVVRVCAVRGRAANIARRAAVEATQSGENSNVQR
ncbi:MAG: hypothetical protein R3C10_04780 [Pirellulales bacterium]